MKITKESILKSVLTMPIPTWLKQVFNLILNYVGQFNEDLSNKADLVGGKIPESQLPSYVDDVIEGEMIYILTDVNTILNVSKYNDTIIFTTANSIDPFKNSVIHTGINKKVTDWTVDKLEEGKIYINKSNNHSYRWSGSSLVDLDKEFTDGIASLQNALLQLNINTVTDINDLSDNTSSQNTLGLIYNNVLKPTDSVTFRNCFIRFSYNNATYAYPILDRDPVNKTFKVYNHGNLQTYKILLNGSTYSMKKVQDIPGYVMLGDTDSGIDNKAVLDTLKEYEIINCVFNYSGTYLLGVLKKEASLSFFSAFDGRLIKTITINSTNGTINVLTNVGTDQLLSFSSYISYGGKKNVSDFYYTMATQFTANVLVIDNIALNKVVTDITTINKLLKVSYLVVTNIPDNAAPVIFTTGLESSSQIIFININYTDGRYISAKRISFNKSSHLLSSIDYPTLYNGYGKYILAGGTKTEAEYYAKLNQLIDA